MTLLILTSASFTMGYLIGVSVRDSRDTGRRSRMGKADSSWLNKKL